MEKPYTWPEKCEMEDIENYIDWNDTSESILTTRMKEILIKIDKPKIIIDFVFSKNCFLNADKYCYTLCNNSSKIYNIPMKRFVNTNEFLMLQGFDVNFIKVVSNTQLKKQIGNSMSVNVIVNIFKNLL